jgi:hypothetical protein
LKEIAMHAKSIARAAIALAAFTVGVAFASEAASPTTIDKDTPIVLAQASTTMPAAPVTMAPAFPAHETRVRAAAAQGPEALRRYIWRTRMIYNFYYWDFAPKP